MLAHLHSTELAINHVALSRTSKTSGHLDFEQIEVLYAAIESIKYWFEVFFSIPPISYIGFPFSIFSQLRHSLATLYRLSTLDSPGWDKGGVRKAANLNHILDQVINNLEQVAPAAGLDNTGSTEGDVFGRSAKLFRRLRTQWEEKLGPDSDVATGIPDSQLASDLSLPDPFVMDLTDNDWLTNFYFAPNY